MRDEASVDISRGRANLTPRFDGTSLADRLRRLRTSAGLSYQLLSDRSNVDVKYLYELETGRKARPSRDVIIRIGIGLGLELLDIDELLIAASHLPLTPVRRSPSSSPPQSGRPLEDVRA